MKKMIEVVDDRGLPTMIPFHRVVRMTKETSPASYRTCVTFHMDDGIKVYISDPDAGEKAWATYRAWVESLA
jgi:hypothetical protein